MEGLDSTKEITKKSGTEEKWPPTKAVISDATAAYDRLATANTLINSARVMGVE